MFAVIFSEDQYLSTQLEKILHRAGCSVHVFDKRQPLPVDISYLFVILKTSKKPPLTIYRLLDNKKIKTCIVSDIQNVVDIQRLGNAPLIYLGEGSNTEQVFQDMVHNMFSFGFPKKEMTFGVKPTKTKTTPQLLPRSLLFLSSFIFSLICLPFLLLIFSTFTLAVSFALLTTHHYRLATTPLFITASLAHENKEELVYLTKIPVINRGFTLVQRISTVEENLSYIGLNSLTLLQETQTLTKSLLDTSKPASHETLISIDKNIATLDTHLVAFQNEITLIPALSKLFHNHTQSFNNLKNYIHQSTLISSDLPDLLGFTSPRNYMIIFQNTSELRPTGGFIGSFAIATLDQAHISNMKIYDVYSADGQLKGHVEPPVQIKNYLHEANWYLRDSNWNPDFTKSAQNAQWFIDKEMDIAIDGVISLDSEFVVSLLNATGPIHLPTITQEVTSKNFYALLNDQIVNDFFPGSRKKENVLTDLYHQLLTKLSTSTSSEVLARLVFVALNEKHIQIYTNIKNTDLALANLNWNGKLAKSNCNSTCDSLYLAIVEANLGINKVNTSITRNASLTQKITDTKITNQLKIDFTNTNPSLPYENYLRVITNKESQFDAFQIAGTRLTTTTIPDLEKQDDHLISAGSLITIAPNSRSTVTLTWTTPVKTSNLHFYIRKQSGLLNFPMKISIENTPKVDYTTDLTTDFTYEYLHN